MQGAPPVREKALYLVDRERDALGTSIARSLRLMRSGADFDGDRDALEAVARKLRGIGWEDKRASHDVR